MASLRDPPDPMVRAHFPLLVLGLVFGLSELPAQGELIRAPYIQLTTRSSGIVAWRTSEAITPVVRYGLAPDNLDQAVATEQIVMRVSPEMKELPEAPRLGQTTPEGIYQF